MPTVTMVAMLLPTPLKRLWRSQPMTPTSVTGGSTSSGGGVSGAARVGESLTQRSLIWAARL